MFLLWLQAEAPDLSSGNQTQDNRQVIFTNEPSLQSRLQYIFGQQERMNGPDYFIISLSCDFMGSWLRGILTDSLKLLNPLRTDWGNSLLTLCVQVGGVNFRQF